MEQELGKFIISRFTFVLPTSHHQVIHFKLSIRLLLQIYWISQSNHCLGFYINCFYEIYLIQYSRWFPFAKFNAIIFEKCIFQYTKFSKLLYFCPWTKMNNDNKKTLLMLMVMGNKPTQLKIVTGFETNLRVLVPVSFQLFSLRYIY